MNDNVAEQGGEALPRRGSLNLNWIVLLLGIALVVSAGYAWFQHRSIQKLVNDRDQLAGSLSQTKAEVDSLSAQMKALAEARRAADTTAASAAQAVRQPPSRTVRHSAVQRPRVAQTPAEDPRWKKIDAELAKTRSDLETSIKSSHEELSGSIAKTHEELVALEKKGERNYFEFDLTKSKQFERTGPIGISLRKANTKHKYCDLELRVDDNQVSKKHLNLFEPVYFSPEGYSQPLELVVNRIDKNHIKGYVSIPKYGQTRVAATDSTQGGSAPSSPTAPTGKPEPVMVTRP